MVSVLRKSLQKKHFDGMTDPIIQFEIREFTSGFYNPNPSCKPITIITLKAFVPFPKRRKNATKTT